MRGVVLLLAAGGGERLGRGPKAFVELGGVPLLRRAAEGAAAARLVAGVVAAVPAGWERRAERLLAGLGVPVRVVAGGPTRQASALAALRAAEAEAVAVHDAARALCPPGLFDACLEALDRADAAIPALPLADTVKRVEDGAVAATLDRSLLVGAQTPQAFRAQVYRKAHEAALAAGFEATDDAALVERLGVRVVVVPGDPANLKITTPADLRLAELLLGAEG